MKKFCPKCGKTEDEIEFIEGFCKDDYLAKHTPTGLPKEVNLIFCKHCGKVKVGRSWQVRDIEIIENQVLAKAKPEMMIQKQQGQILDEKDKHFTMEVQTKGRIGKTFLTLKDEIKVKKKYETCQTCARLNGGYFEATIQIRYEHRPGKKEARDQLEEIDSLLQTERKKGDSLAEMVKLKELKNGFDIQIGSRNAARKVSKTLATKFDTLKQWKSTKTLVTENKGKRVYRDTYIVRVEK